MEGKERERGRKEEIVQRISYITQYAAFSCIAKSLENSYASGIHDNSF